MAPKKKGSAAKPKAAKAKAKATAAAEAATTSGPAEGHAFDTFKSLKEGFDSHANDAGYVNITDSKAIAAISKFLGLDADIVSSEMKAIDFDANNFVSFAEFALWADKHTVGIPLGLDVPDKRIWQKGCPEYWTTIPEPEPIEELPAASSVASSEPVVASPGFVAVPPDPDDSELNDLIDAAKDFEWDKAWKILERHPGYVDMRPPYRRFGAIHQAAFEGKIPILKKYVEEFKGDPKLPSKDGLTPEQVARGEGNTAAGDYLAAAADKAYAVVAVGAKRMKVAAPAGRGGPAIDPEMLEMANEIIEKAKWQKWKEMLELIDSNPACVNMRPEYRKFGAIHQVAYAGDADVLKKMIDLNADPCLLTRDNETPLEIAKAESNNKAAEFLASLEGASTLGATIQKAHAVIDAAKDGKWEKTFELLKEDPELVNVRPEVRQYAVIHQAAFHGDIEVLRRLIEDFKANVKLPTKDGRNALQIARDSKQDMAAGYLEACTPTIQLDDDFVKYPDQELVKVTDTKVLSKFKELLEKTHKKSANWTRDRDMASGTYCSGTPVPTGYELVGVVRNENPALWRIYQVYREVTKETCKKADKKVPFHSWAPITMESGIDWSDFGFVAEANEWLLLHASIPEAITAISRKGFTMAKLGTGGTTGSGGLYGDGTYFADCVTKADEYARRKVEKGEFKGCHALGIVRVVGGKHFYTDKDVADKDKPKFAERVLQGNYNSTVGDRLKLKNTFREYVVYDASATYLEYIVYYKRKGVPKKHE